MKDDELFPSFFEKLVTESASVPAKIMVYRLAPKDGINGLHDPGYLKSFHLPITIPDIIEEIGMEHGGGEYQIKIVDEDGKYLKSKTFQIAGLPKTPMATKKPEEKTLKKFQAPSAKEMKNLLTQQALEMLNGFSNQSDRLETLRFLKELYAL